MNPIPHDFLNPPMPDVLEQWRFFFDTLGIQSGEEVLSLVTDNGDTEAFLTTLYPCIEKVVGLKTDIEAVAIAEERIKTAFFGEKATYIQRHQQKLPFENESFERAICFNSLSTHHPTELLAEIHRVLKPSGVALIAQTDWETQIYNSRQNDLNKSVLSKFCEGLSEARLGRQLYGICRATQFQSLEVGVFTLLNHRFEANYYSYQMAQYIREVLQNMLSKEELDTWMGDLKALGVSGEFFYSVNTYYCLCRK